MKLTEKYDETYWINALKAGNEQAFHYFFNLHNKSLCYFAAKLLQDQLQAEEIVSDCFIKLWERQQNFETAENIKAFLYITCRNSCLKHLRDLKKKTAKQEIYLSHLETSEESVLYEIIDTEIITILGREIEALPDKCREVFNLIYLEGKKTDEIAAMLNISIQTVRNHKTRAVELLKTSILKKGLSHAITLAFLLFIAD